MKKIIALLVAGSFFTTAFAAETASAPMTGHKATASKVHKKTHKHKKQASGTCKSKKCTASKAE